MQPASAFISPEPETPQQHSEHTPRRGTNTCSIFLHTVKGQTFTSWEMQDIMLLNTQP